MVEEGSWTTLRKVPGKELEKTKYRAAQHKASDCLLLLQDDEEEERWWKRGRQSQLSSQQKVVRWKRNGGEKRETGDRRLETGEVDYTVKKRPEKKGDCKDHHPFHCYEDEDELNPT